MWPTSIDQDSREIIVRNIWVYVSVVLLVVAGSLATGCLDFPSEPVFPTWDVDVSVALTNSSHSIRGMVLELTGLPPEILDTLDIGGWSGDYHRTVPIGDSSAGGLDGDHFSSEFLADVRSALLYVEGANASPVGLGVFVELLDSLDRTVFTLPDEGGMIGLPPAPVDATGKTGPATRSTSTLTFDQSTVSGLGRISHLRYTIHIEVPEGVSFRSIATSDTVGVRAWGTFRTTVNR